VRLVLDVNFGTDWAAALSDHGADAVHWTEVGDPRASDEEVVEWARRNRCAIVTQDKGVASRVVLRHVTAPSVIQIRNAQAMKPGLSARVAALAKVHASDLERGAILVLDARTGNVRVRPLSV
jgi:predicted nuclease of predicted toxin-antitoxin system